MTIPGLPPVHGTPIGNLVDVARMASHAFQRVRAALSPDTGMGLHSTSSGRSVTISPNLPTRLICFEIVTCWRKIGPAKSGPKTQGLFWVCKGKPVKFWWDWGDQGDSNQPENVFWKALEVNSPNLLSNLWWPIAGPPHEPHKCPEGNGGSQQSSASSSVGGSASASTTGSGSGVAGSSGSSSGKHDCYWQEVLYPLYGRG